jgi:hypothetical protein
MLKALITLPGQFLYYGVALLAVVAVNSGDLSGILGMLGTTIGINALSNMLERVARGDDVPEEEIRKTLCSGLPPSATKPFCSPYWTPV